MSIHSSPFRPLLFLAAIAIGLSTAVYSTQGATITLTPAKDNTIYQETSGGASNGAGDYFFAGLTGNNLARHALIYFDIASALPPDAIITGVSLRLYTSRVFPGSVSSTVSLYPLLADWGEGTSRAPGEEGSGGAATPGDATWLYRSFATASWATPGGDFDPKASAATTVANVATAYTWTGSGMVTDVQHWLDNPASNFGWLIRDEELNSGSAKRFNSRTNPDTTTRPQLTIEYQTVPEPAAAGLVIAGTVLMGSLRRTRKGVVLAASLAAIAGTNAAQAQSPIPEVIQKGTIQISLQPVATGLVSPELLLAAPGDASRQFIVEQSGAVRVLQNGSLLSTPFLDVSSRLVTLRPGYDERGFLGMAFDPGFSNPASPGFGRIFTYTSEPATGTPDYAVPFSGAEDHQSVVASWRVDVNNSTRIDPASRTELLRFGEPQSNHNGGMIAFGPDGYLYIGTGDGGNANDTGTGHNPTTGNAQDSSTVLGKMLRLDVNGTNSANGRYGIPADNPFATSGGAKEIFASGFRNPFRFSFDGNKLLVGDVGQNNIEEVDLVELGKDYGWNYKEGTFKFDPVSGKVTSDLTGVPAGLTDPILQYDHDEGISIIGGFVYHGALIPELAGKYIFGDFARSFSTPNGRLFYADLDTHEIREFLIGNNESLGLYVKGIGQDASGELYVLGSTVLGPSGETGVALKVVPEPTVTGFCAAGLGLVAVRRRRRVA